MKRIVTTIAVITLPLFTLALGWQLGMRSHSGGVRVTGMELLDGQAASGTVLGDPEDEVDLSLLWETWRVLQAKYIYPQDLQTSQMVLGAVRGMVEGIGDPYTVFMSAKENKEFRDSLAGDLQGIGAELGQKDGIITIIAPLKGSPAEAAGLAPGDRILKVNDDITADLSLQEVVQRIRGPQGTEVTLTIARADDDELKTVTIVRQEIHLPSVESSTRDTDAGRIGIIALYQFGSDSAVELREALAELEVEELAGLVLDLRGNGGGYLDGAVDIVSLFVPEGEIVSVQGRDGELQKHVANRRPLDTTTPLAILINQGSASAAEITAGALQDMRRAMIVGMKSFGKGSVQEIIELPGGASLRVTYARWLTPSGRDISKDGIQPDLVVDLTHEDAQAERDPQLERALEWLQQPVLPTPTESDDLSSATPAAE